MVLAQGRANYNLRPCHLPGPPRPSKRLETCAPQRAFDSSCLDGVSAVSRPEASGGQLQAGGRKASGTRDFKLRGVSQVSFHAPSHTDPGPNQTERLGVRAPAWPRSPSWAAWRWLQVTVRVPPLLGHQGFSEPAGLVTSVTSLNSHESQASWCHCVSCLRAPGHGGAEDPPGVAQLGQGQWCPSPGSLGTWLPLWTTAGELPMGPRLCPAPRCPAACCGPCPLGLCEAAPSPVRLSGPCALGFGGPCTQRHGQVGCPSALR